MLENVQIRATKLVDGLGSLDYPERLRKLQLPTLAYRRARGDMIEVYKHIHTYDRAILSSYFQLQPRGSRKHDFQLVWNMPKDSTRGLQANSFYYRTTRIWNDSRKRSLTQKNINAAFKSLLDEVWKDKATTYNSAIITIDS